MYGTAYEPTDGLAAAEMRLTANQWYWVYGIEGTSIYSYASREQELLCGDVRLLASTQYTILYRV